MTSAALSMTWLLVAVMAVAWLAATAVAPALLRRAALPGLDPQARKMRLLLVALLPWAIPLLAVSAVLAPAIAKPLGVIAHHCVEHGPGHPHICLAHPPIVALSAWHWLAVTFAFLWLLWSIGTHVLRRRHALLQLRSLLAFAGGSGPVRTLDTPHVVALTADPGHPVILLSSELRRRLHPRHRRIVLAHEVAHLRHGDLYFSRLIDALLVPHVRPVAKRMRMAWRQAIEEHADDVVAARFGREDVAQALVRVARMPAVSAGSALRATGGNAVQRIERLLDAPTEMRGRAAFAAGYAGAMLGSWVVLVWAHHTIETLLGWIG
ncbi:MAG TPA: M56 family metallopeptidase [Gammaproteobacteria bacterium]|nr:M56 family metallopeptidase [Gammaproteobacteria bacterium]